MDRLEKKTQKRISVSALKRLAKKAGLRWKRVRKSLKSFRDPKAFERCKRELEALKKYLSAYSPELNLIEILWWRIKYSWLPFSAYECLNALIEGLENILRDVGSEYQITFA